MSGQAREILPHWVVSNKINEIKQDLRYSQGQYLDSTKEKIIKWCELLEQDEQRTEPVSTICYEVIQECENDNLDVGLRQIYRYIPNRFKDPKQQGNALGERDPWLTNDSQTELTKIPDIPNLETASHDDLMQYIEAKDDWERDCNRRAKEHKADKIKAITVARAKGWPIPIHTPDVVSTPLPYDLKYGYFYEELVGPRLESDPEYTVVVHGGLADLLDSLKKTIVEIATNSMKYPPETVKEDKDIAQGFKAWTLLFKWWNEQLRPYADLKFSKSYPAWFETQAVNRDHGKHCAAVDNKTATLTGNLRAMTREQVGDKAVFHAQKAIEFKGMLEIANRAFLLMQKKLPHWHKRRVGPAVYTRKELVAPKLSESSFGSDKS